MNTMKKESAGRASPPVMYYLHIHKGGGSSFIALARANGRTFWSPHKNGNPIFPYPDQKFSFRDRRIPFWLWDEKHQTDFVLSGAADFICNERCLGNAMPNDERILFATTLRNPIDLVISNYRQRQRRGFFSEEETLAECVRQARYAWLDNYLVRHFIPEKENTRVTPADLAMAKERLSRFGLVMFLEEYKTLPKHD